MNRGIARLIVAVCVSVLVALPASALAGKVARPSVTDQIIESLDEDYARVIMEDVCAMGDGPLGFRGTGGPADHQVAQYIAEEMTAMGLEDVDLEEVPVNSWEFRSAYLDVPGIGKMEAASFGGFPGTDDQGTDAAEFIEREIVWVNDGYDADYIGKDVTDRIVLVNWIGYDFWVDSIAYGAHEHGAVGIVVTTIDSNVGQNDWALSCHDGLYVTGWPPLISISPENATLIIEALEDGEPLKVKMYSDIVKVPDLGGVGYNVVGYLPGKNFGTSEDEFVIIGPHHDAWFTGAMDDTSGIACMLVMAKAMADVSTETGWVPDRTIVFTSHTAEEYGIDDTYFDWCWGAYYQINVEHADDWVGRTVAYISLELMGMAGEPVYINCVPEVYSFVKQVLSSNRDSLPYGATVDNNAHTWADHWTFSAAGVPGIEFETVSEDWETYYYHTQCDAIGMIDYGYMMQLFSVLSDMTMKLATSQIVPYNFGTLAQDLNGHLNGDLLWGVSDLYGIYGEYGFDPASTLAPLLSAAALFEANSGELSSALISMSPEDASAVNTAMMDIVWTLDTTMVAIGVWEQDWYPYQQPINDVYHLYDGITALKSGHGQSVLDYAVGTLNWVGMVWYYDYMSYGNYLDQRDRLTGDRVASWGLQTHLQLSVDIWPEYDELMQLRDLGASYADLESVIESLEGKLVTVSLVQLENAFGWMLEALQLANEKIDALMETL